MKKLTGSCEESVNTERGHFEDRWHTQSNRRETYPGLFEDSRTWIAEICVDRRELKCPNVKEVN